MGRKELIDQVQNYKPYDQKEKQMVDRFYRFINKHTNCFERDLLIGHVTASAFIVNEKKSHTLLLHHKKLNRWLQPGGHCDGDSNTYLVAKKEVEEETGILVGAQDNQIFDIDIHVIPERKGIPEHEHFDIRYLFVIPSSTQVVKNEESNDLQWISLDEIGKFTQEESVLRMSRKLTS